MRKVLEVKDISKVYRIYKNSADRLIELFTKRKRHKEFVANRAISFDLFEGETLGIIGINGAGKSTILKIIAGVVAPTSGEVLRHGRVTALLELGTGFNDELDGIENIYLNGTLIGMSKEEIERKREEIIAFSELGDYIYESIKTYSSGMRMRLAFSIAIFSEPGVLIVDEALSVGDAHFQQKSTNALKERKTRHMSIIYVSHDLNSLKILCDRVLLLNHGEIAKEGSPEEVINSYNFLIAKLNDSEEKIQMEHDSSFGSLEAQIEALSITGASSNSNVISSGETATIALHVRANQTIERVTIGIMIRDRFAQDIFGTNTHYHDRTFLMKEGERFTCTFTMPLNLGAGKYTITAAIHEDETHLQKCYHWLDNGATFEVAGNVGAVFAGLCRLEPAIEIIADEN